MKSDRREAPTLARDIAAFVLRFLAISIALYVLFYLFAGAYYVRLVALIAGPMLSAFGHSIVLRGVQRIAEDITFNPIVFLSLAAAVGRIAITIDDSLGRNIELMDGRALHGLIRGVSVPAKAAAASPAATPADSPACPVCQSAMVKRTAKRGANSGNAFWGCSQYPGCKGTRPA